MVRILRIVGAEADNVAACARVVTEHVFNLILGEVSVGGFL